MLILKTKRPKTSTRLTSVGVGGARLILVNQGFYLVWPEAGEELLVEPRVSLLLVEELGKAVFGHVGFGRAGRKGGGGAQSAVTSVSTSTDYTWSHGATA